jgi:hypothetical protein
MKVCKIRLDNVEYFIEVSKKLKEEIAHNIIIPFFLQPIKEVKR